MTRHDFDEALDAAAVRDLPEAHYLAAEESDTCSRPSGDKVSGRLGFLVVAVAAVASYYGIVGLWDPCAGSVASRENDTAAAAAGGVTPLALEERSGSGPKSSGDYARQAVAHPEGDLAFEYQEVDSQAGAVTAWKSPH